MSAEALAEADADPLIAEDRGRRFHDGELVFAEAPWKQNQLTNHSRKLKLWSRKQRGSPGRRQVGLEENDVGVFAIAHMGMCVYIYISSQIIATSTT